MEAVTNKSGRVIATFAHHSDTVQFLEANPHYAARDEPELDRVIADHLNTPLVDDSWRRVPGG